MLHVVCAALLSLQATKLLEVNGTFAAGGFGWSVDGAGDANGDGVPDLIAGAPLASSATGKARLLSGADGSSLAQYNGVLANGMFGGVVAGLGDLNADGKSDVAVGCFYSGSIFQQYAKVFSGADGSLVHTFLGDPGEGLGTSIARVGDVNGDGRADLLVGCPQFASLKGRAILYSGLDGSVLRTLLGPPTVGFFGISVAGPGDLSGDGVPDLVVTASGFAYAYSGADGALLFTMSGSASDTEFGRVASAGVDVDGDGIGDIAVGAWVFPATGEGDPKGIVRVFSGKDGSLYRTLLGKGAAPIEGPIVLLPDVTGDGLGELAAGSVKTERVSVFDLTNGKTLATILGTVGDASGTAIGAAGDVNLDGKVDLAVGALAGGPSGASGPAGQLRVFSIDPKFPQVRRKICLARPVVAADPDASGVAELGIKPGEQSVKITSKGLAGDEKIFLETGAATGLFTQIGALTAGKATVLFAPTPFALLGVTFLAELAGRRIEVRDAGDVVLLSAVIPDFSAPSVKTKVDFTGAAATGTLSLEFNKTLGSSKVAVSTKGLAVGPAFSLWVEDAPASDVFVEVAALAKGKLTLDTKKGDALPLGAASIAALSGRRAQVREGATVLLDALIP